MISIHRKLDKVDNWVEGIRAEFRAMREFYY